MKMRCTSTGVELLIEKLKQLITNDYNPLINNHPSVLEQTPQFQLLFDELDFMIHTLLLIYDEHPDQLQQVTDLRKRFEDAAEEARDIVDLFLYNINLENQISLNQPPASPSKIFKDAEEDPPASTSKRSEGGCFPRLSCCSVCGMSTKLVKNEKVSLNLEVKKEKISLNLEAKKEHVSLNLEDVMTSIKSIKKAFVKIRNNLEMDSAPMTDQIETVPSAAGGTSCTKSPLGTKNTYEDIVVGFDRHAELVRDKLVEDQKQLDVVSIVGMGGLGKTTLATKVFNDPFVTYHFHVRGWVMVSQTYDKKVLLIQILESIKKINDVRDKDYSQLRQILRQNLLQKRYLIVIDDIWNTEAWDDLKLSFPDDNNGSRILLTSRIKEVVSHAKPNGFIHQLEYLTDEESWEFLCMKVFRGSNVCPEWLIETGREIARNCHGLPLTLVVVAGVLVKEAVSKDSWEKIGRSVSSYVVSGQTEYIKQLALSLDHLPGHLRECFLYLGGFPEDYKFRVKCLVWLWMAEGFIQEDGSRSLEEIGEDCLMELVDRNLVVVADKKSNDDIKSFYVHDLLRELCIKIATEENFYFRADYKTRSVEAYKPCRLFIKDDIIITKASSIRSFVYVGRVGDIRAISKWSQFWMLLMVLDLRLYVPLYFPEVIARLVNLRYLAIRLLPGQEFPSSICSLWSLQTLIFSRPPKYLKLPETISKLVNLRHLILEKGVFKISFPTIEKPMNLQTISMVRLGDVAESLVKCIPDIKKLSCTIVTGYNTCDFESLTSLEYLKLEANRNLVGFGREPKFIRFPLSLNSLTLKECYLRWSKMSIIQSLPNLQVFKLRYKSFVGCRWDAGEEPFPQLKVLKLSDLEIQEWEASGINFPCLKQLVVDTCFFLEEIPSDIGYIPTLELINVIHCKDSLVESLDTIKKEQHAQGNFDLKITVYQ